MEAQHRRPLMAYLTVCLVCGLLIGQPDVLRTVIDTVGGDRQPTDSRDHDRGVEPSDVPPTTQPGDPTAFATMIVGEAIRIEPEDTGGPEGQGGLPETLPSGPPEPIPSATSQPTPHGTPATGAANPGQGVTPTPGPRNSGGPMPPTPSGVPKPTPGPRHTPDLLPGSATPKSQPEQ